MNKDIYKLIPQEVKDILYQSEGWLVGSSVNKLITNESVRDFDILITNAKFYSKIICGNKNNFNRFTTFGGINLKINDFSIDIWHQSLEDFIINSADTGVMYNILKYKTLNCI